MKPQKQRCPVCNRMVKVIDEAEDSDEIVIERHKNLFVNRICRGSFAVLDESREREWQEA